MKLRSILAIVAISALTIASIVPAAAQGGGGGGFGGGQGRRGGQRGGGGIYGLVGRPDVQTDIKLTDDQKTKIKAAQDDMRQKMQGMFQPGGDRSAMQAAMMKMQEETATTMKGILTPEQVDRLIQIYIQLNPVTAVTNADVQKKVGLSDATIAKIKTLQEAQQKANGDIRQKQQSGELDQAAAREAMTKNTDILKTELEKALTDDEKKKLKDAEGPKFTPEAPPAGN